MSKHIWERHYYLNKDNDLLINNDIFEYDIKSAGLSLAKEYKYLDINIVNKLEKMDKYERNRLMGIMKINNTDLVKHENQGLVESRRKFILSNEIEPDEIISIKKDALFVNRKCSNLTFGNIEFVPKNRYTTYMYMNNIEFYYNHDKLDIKGINDEILFLHNDYMISFFKKYLRLLQGSRINELIEYSTEFLYAYKIRALDIEYYREFNRISKYKLTKKTCYNTEFMIDYVDKESFDMIDITYNYFMYLVPLTVMLV